ncbi:MAG: hypothetical protein ChlgKO_14430 [Chlamydiales bacterium]
MSAIPSKIQSFFDKGFLPGGKGLDVKRSFDSKTREGVSLNCISNIDGIVNSLLHPAKGGLTVMLEEKIGDGGILDQVLERNEEAIRHKEKELRDTLPLFMRNMVLVGARHAVLKTDKRFIDAVTEKAHMTALFILDIELDEGENISLDGCKEVSRGYISADKIVRVYISEKIIGDTGDPRIIRIPFVLEDFNFCYKDEKGNPQIIKKLGPVYIPNYQKVLEDLISDLNRNLEENPIYTHMTRL